MFLLNGAQPVDWQSPCAAKNTPSSRTCDEAPMATAASVEHNTPASTTRRVPKRSPQIPQTNCPTA